MSEQASFLAEPPATEHTTRLYEEERAEDGYVWNVTRLWSWRPETYEGLAALRSALMSTSRLTERDWAVMVTATASALRDSYCSLAWGPKLAALSDPETAAAVINGADRPGGLSEPEAALAAWARQLVRDPNGTSLTDIERLREVGLGDREIFEATTFIALRLAFSTVNDALGAAPDQQLADRAPAPIKNAVSYGRPAAAEPSRP
jgi:uncharacterized peroxidase-related enzyme